MINELNEALAAHPENPFLQGHVSALENMPNCRNCTHCGPDLGTHYKSGVPLIQCNHPDWGDEETEMREIDPSFGEMCADHSRQNAELCQPCPPSTPPRQPTADGQGLA